MFCLSAGNVLFAYYVAIYSSLKQCRFSLLVFFGLCLQTGEIKFVMADCAVLLAHPETRMASLVSADGWLSVDFTHRSLTITEECCML